MEPLLGDYAATSSSRNSGTRRSKNASEKGNIRSGIREWYATLALLIPEAFPQSKKTIFLLRFLCENEAENETMIEMLKAECEVRTGRPRTF
jgi:hypothetical protein